jgi:hypothetical protein
MAHWRSNGLDSFNGQYQSNEPVKRVGCRHIGNLTRSVLDHNGFAIDPVKVALEVWSAAPSEKKPAANGSVMRTSVIGAYLVAPDLLGS